jgi:hypothetical protein
VGSGLPDHRIGIWLLSAFGYTEKLPVYEVAPCTVRYLETLTALTDKKYAAALADVYGRPRVIIDSLPSGWDPSSIFQVDIAKVLGDTLSKTNPVITRLVDDTDFIVPALSSQLPDALDGGALKIKEQVPLSEITVNNFPTKFDVGNFPTDYPDAALAALLPPELDTGALKIREQNWPTVLQTPTSIGTLADVTAAASATQLTAPSTPCKTVTVCALSTNTGIVRVGDANVSASRGHELTAGKPVDIVIDNVNRVYVFGNATDKVSVVYVN